ncbi:MAG: TIGR03619 family F420-dependent LLM class oxidoreductase, partial [Myxococcota bacterium]
LLRRCAREAEQAGLESLWVVDHVAIPPEDAEGSEGRYLDPLATLAFLAGSTSRIGLGVGVLVLPYRPALPTAKWIATLQELSGERLLLGVGAGWMRPEFRALGIDRRRRGAMTDEILDFLKRCFAADEVEAHGQRFLFRPRPAPPPIYVGGVPPHAFERALRFADGWMPMGIGPEPLAPLAADLRTRFAAAGRPTPEVVTFDGLPLDDPAKTRERLAQWEEAGATRIVHGLGRYSDAGPVLRAIERLSRLR